MSSLALGSSGKHGALPCLLHMLSWLSFLAMVPLRSSGASVRDQAIGILDSIAAREEAVRTGRITVTRLVPIDTTAKITNETIAMAKGYSEAYARERGVTIAEARQHVLETMNQAPDGRTAEIVFDHDAGLLGERLPQSGEVLLTERGKSVRRRHVFVGPDSTHNILDSPAEWRCSVFPNDGMMSDKHAMLSGRLGSKWAKIVRDDALEVTGVQTDDTGAVRIQLGGRGPIDRQFILAISEGRQIASVQLLDRKGTEVARDIITYNAETAFPEMVVRSHGGKVFTYTSDAVVLNANVSNAVAEMARIPCGVMVVDHRFDSPVPYVQSTPPITDEELLELVDDREALEQHLIERASSGCKGPVDKVGQQAAVGVVLCLSVICLWGWRGRRRVACTEA